MRTKQLFASLLATLPLCAVAWSSNFPHADILEKRDPTTPTDAGSVPPEEVIATAWYPSWLGESFPPDRISWSKYNTMTFAFALTTSDPNILLLDENSKVLLPKFVSEAKKNNVNALLSIGGWTGSQHFSSAVATAASRTAFVKALVGLATQFDLDGLDFDWEYPYKQGLGCNEISPQDSENFLLLLHELKSDPVGSQLLLSAAVGTSPFNGPDGKPLEDVSGFSDVLDFIAIMAYDIWGAWGLTVGPNAPLQDSCAASPAGSGASAVTAWTTAGFPVGKIVLGVAAYGRTYSVSNLEAANIGNFPLFDVTKKLLGQGETDVSGVDQCGNPNIASGVFNFEGLITAGFLTSEGKVTSGKSYKFDTCSQTPFLYDWNSQVMVSYDDAASFASKGQFIKEKGLKGFAMWHAVGDSDDILLDSISEAMELAFDYC